MAAPLRQLLGPLVLRGWRDRLVGATLPVGARSFTPVPEPPSAADKKRSAEVGGGVEGESKEDLDARKRRIVKEFVDKQLGGAGDPDRGALAALLASHGVVVRGGREQAAALMDALAAWKRGEWRPERPSE
ncbi:hypothetical protein HYH03_007168 [Edaphochlamys debaryana]|uniref:Uncharacterized protein n=1 Tax=Edaphochlamys debaryana TaxID=47281 RepID=A0A836C064_9CHLO|nr:hypothetical protein HYH03_007168 [Edaphochlamys debaryana]|eukprot:KAG2494652.1 hypothetical protein HYH03_007168 [Edaphochlamys debaryana]